MESHGFEEGCPSSVAIRLLLVDRTVDLHDEADGGAIEVGKKRADRVLASELEA
jgi:hypothetical protein